MTTVQATTRQDHAWPEEGTKIREAAQYRENLHGNNRSQNSTILDDWEEFTLLILTTKITKKLSKMQGGNSKDLWQQPCRAKGKLGPAPRRWLQRRKLHPKRFQKTVYGCKVESHDSTRQRV